MDLDKDGPDKPQVIEQDGKPAFVVVPIAAWSRIEAALEELENIRLYDRAKSRDSERVPAAIVDALLGGASPIRVWRQHRGMTQSALAAACGIAKPYVSQLESGTRKASQALLRRLAHALRVDIDDLV